MRMRKRHNVEPRMERCQSVWIQNPEELLGNWRSLMPQAQELRVEVGCGKGKFTVDLRGALALRMARIGLEPGNIAVSGECTVESHDKYWSHRYTSRYGLKRGSQCAVIQL